MSLKIYVFQNSKSCAFQNLKCIKCFTVLSNSFFFYRERTKVVTAPNRLIWTPFSVNISVSRSWKTCSSRTKSFFRSSATGCRLPTTSICGFGESRRASVKRTIAVECWILWKFGMTNVTDVPLVLRTLTKNMKNI